MWLIILAVVLVAGIGYLILSNDAPKSGDNEEAGTELTISNNFIEITGFDYKKNLFGKWVINGHLKNQSAYDIDRIEFAVKFSDNTEFAMYESTVSAGQKDHPFELKLTGHKGEELISLNVREVFKQE